jgi:cytidylate kinase
MLIGIVGPCGAGKTTLLGGLSKHGWNARAIAQEHSFVPTMWKQLTNPDVLIYLQASCEVGAKRRQMDWTYEEWQEQQDRLRHARSHANYFLDTDNLSIQEVLLNVLHFLQKKRSTDYSQYDK